MQQPFAQFCTPFSHISFVAHFLIEFQTVTPFFIPHIVADFLTRMFNVNFYDMMSHKPQPKH